MVVRIRLTIDKVSSSREQNTHPPRCALSSKPSEFAVALEFRTYLGPLLVWIEELPRRDLPKEVHDGLKQTLEWKESNDRLINLSTLMGEFAKKEALGDWISCKVLKGELSKQLSKHQRWLSEVLWGDTVWGPILAEEIRKRFRKLANKGLYLELVLHDDMHQYMWELLHFEEEIAGNLSIVRMQTGTMHRESLWGFRLRKKKARLLTIIANPDDRKLGGDLFELASEIKDVLAAVSFQSEQVDYRKHKGYTVSQSTSRQVQNLYKRGMKYNIWFLVVHGSAEHGGLLYYEDEDSRSQEKRLTSLYQDSRGNPPDICILFACDIAGFGSQFVDGLLARDVKLVVAMQAPISFSAAGAFAKFWQELDKSRYISLHTFEEAIKEARTEIPEKKEHEQIIPVLYTRTRYGWPDWTGLTLMVFLLVITITIALSVGPISSLLVPTPGATVGSILKIAPATSTPAPTLTTTATLTLIPTPVYSPLVIIDGQRHEVPPADPITTTAKAGSTIRIEISLEDATGQRMPPNQATYQWCFSPLDPENARRVGTRNAELNYTVPTGREGQLITIDVEAAGYRRIIVIRIIIQ